MPKIQGISSKQAIKVFQKVGFTIKRQSGHIVMSNEKITLIIPRSNQINAITMGNIARDAGLTPDQFKQLC